MQPRHLKPATKPILSKDVSTQHSDQSGIVVGTRVLCDTGEVAVERIKAGTRVITRDAGMITVNSVSRTRKLMRSIFFAAGSLGDTQPDRDLILPADQRILIRDWRAQAMFGASQAFVTAGALVDGEFVCDLGSRVLTLHQIHFERPHVIYAGGLEVASQVSAAYQVRSAA